MEQTPLTEITSRTAALQRALAENNLDLALVRQVSDLFYYTGTIVDGFLALSPRAHPLLLVRRPKQRAVAAPSDWSQVFYEDIKELPELLDRAGLAPQGVLGLELDVMPAALYKRLQEQLFPQHPIRDVSPLIRRQRMVKSPYEIEQQRRAAAIMDRVHEQVPELLQPGISELELSAALEYRLRLLGHQGMVRVRNWDLELHYGHVLSGTSGLHPALCRHPQRRPRFQPCLSPGAVIEEAGPG